MMIRSLRSAALPKLCRLTAVRLQPAFYSTAKDTQTARKDKYTRRDLEKNYIGRVQVSEGEDETEIIKSVNELISKGWIVSKMSTLRKNYRFEAYEKVLLLHAKIGEKAIAQNHHPKVTTTHTDLAVFWRTFHPSGISKKDIEMAAVTEELANDLGPVPRQSETAGEEE